MTAAIVVFLVLALPARPLPDLRDQGRARVRARDRLPPRAPAAGAERAGALPPDPGRRPDGQGRPPDDHAQHPAAGGDHEGQRAGARERGRLLPDRRAEGRDRAGRELHGRDVADRADDAAVGARPAPARRAALGAREDQRDPAGDHRRGDRALGHQGLDRRGQGRRDPGEHAARDGAPGRGRARAAREGDQRRGRVPGLRAAEGRGGRDRAAPDRAAAPLPADAARARLVAVDDDRLPGADRPAQAVPRARASCRAPGLRSRCPAASSSIAPGRARRPGAGAVQARARRPPRSSSGCPFCAGREDRTPPEALPASGRRRRLAGARRARTSIPRSSARRSSSTRRGTCARSRSSTDDEIALVAEAWQRARSDDGRRLRPRARQRGPRRGREPAAHALAARLAPGAAAGGRASSGPSADRLLSRRRTAPRRSRAQTACVALAIAVGRLPYEPLHRAGGPTRAPCRRATASRASWCAARLRRPRAPCR